METKTRIRQTAEERVDDGIYITLIKEMLDSVKCNLETILSSLNEEGHQYCSPEAFRKLEEQSHRITSTNNKILAQLLIRRIGAERTSGKICLSGS
jgi:two-component sensor histidine kinase